MRSGLDLPGHSRQCIGNTSIPSVILALTQLFDDATEGKALVATAPLDRAGISSS
jgi:hypothetical protein